MHPADELAYEQNYRDADPLNLDANAGRDPEIEVLDKFDAFLADFNRKSTFYRKAADEAPAWKKRIFEGGYESVVTKIDVADDLLIEGHFDAAEVVLKKAIDSYDYMEERIQDWATD